MSQFPLLQCFDDSGAIKYVYINPANISHIIDYTGKCHNLPDGPCKYEVYMNNGTVLKVLTNELPRSIETFLVQ